MVFLVHISERSLSLIHIYIRCPVCLPIAASSGRLRRNGDSSVSYTHLDVYKRQASGDDSVCLEQLQRSGGAHLGGVDAGQIIFYMDDVDACLLYTSAGVVAGGAAALQLMRMGERWMLYIPYQRCV